MVDDVMVELEAADLLRVIDRVLEDTSPFAGEAQLVAGEILRIRDAGQLSQKLANDMSVLIYQRRMHSGHSGDFRVTTPIRELQEEVDRDKRERLPSSQSTPILVLPRVADIAAGLQLPMPEAEPSRDQADPLQHAGMTSSSGHEPSVEKGKDSASFMKITYEQPNVPRHTADLSVTGIRVDGVLIDLLGGPEQLVPVLGEPRIQDGLGTAYIAWDDAGIGVSTWGGELSNIDVADSIITPEVSLPTSAGKTRVTVEGRDVLELDWDATPPMDRWTKSINVGAFRVERCETPGCYSFWTFTVAL